MSNTVIKVEGVSKQYRLGTVGTGTLSHDVNRLWHKMRGKEDPYLKIGEENNRTTKGSSDYVWALKQIDFEVKEGEILGVIGKNGAGKSTLLKILSRTTMPSTGSLKIKGRIASLLEVGTGFHPELTGRENVFLNGAILGMTKHEIKRKFEQIVEFSGVERYIDTPVKRYSSGMYVRLAFSVAAHLESEILIVDEVLAVGDADFQKRCIGKMEDVSKGEGRTVLFVSHNMASIKKLCSKGLLLSNGCVDAIDEIDSVTDKYLSEDTKVFSSYKELYQSIFLLQPDASLQIKKVKFLQKGKKVLHTIENGEDLNIIIEYEVLQDTEKLRIYIDLYDKDSDLLLRSFHDENITERLFMKKGKYSSNVVIPKDFLGATKYDVLIGATIHRVRTCWENGALKIPLNIIQTGNYNKNYPDDAFRSKIGLVLNWHTSEL